MRVNKRAFIDSKATQNFMSVSSRSAQFNNVCEIQGQCNLKYAAIQVWRNLSLVQFKFGAIQVWRNSKSMQF